MDGLSHRLSPQENGNHPDLSIGSMTTSGAMTDSAIDLTDGAHPSPIDNDNDGPSNAPCVASASTVQHPMALDSSAEVPSDPTHRGDQEMSDAQGDDHPSTQDKMAIAFILNSDSPSPDASFKALIAEQKSRLRLHLKDSTPSAGEDMTWMPVTITHMAKRFRAAQQIDMCRCILSEKSTGNLQIIRSGCQKMIELFENSILNAKASGSRGAVNSLSESSIEEINGLNKTIDRVSINLFSEILQVNHISTHIYQRQEKAPEKPLRFIADGSKSTVYTIPESSCKQVLKVGPLAFIHQERMNYLSVAQAREKVKSSVRSGMSSGRLGNLHFANVIENVPTGWVLDTVSNILRPCGNIDPRIPGFYDAEGNRIFVNPDEQTGIVLSRVRDLANKDCRSILQKCYALKDTELEEVLDANNHFVVRVYLGRRSNDDEWDDDMDSVSDVTMEDGVDEASITTDGNKLLTTSNLPVYLDQIMEAFQEDPKWPSPEAVAREIAFGYAILHWGACLDGRGIEFLLGSSSNGHGKRLYMLDFEDCRPVLGFTARSVREQLVPAALENDPYIPRATCSRFDVVKHHAWKSFTKHYLEASRNIWEAYDRDFHPSLPRLFIEELKRGFFEQNAERYADAVSDHHVSYEDMAHDQAEQSDDAEIEQGENDNQDREYDGDDEDGQSQVNHDFFENDGYEIEGYDSDAIDSDDSLESEEGSDLEDDDDYDDVD